MTQYPCTHPCEGRGLSPIVSIVLSVILLSREDGLAVIPAQDNVLRLAGNKVAG